MQASSHQGSMHGTPNFNNIHISQEVSVVSTQSENQQQKSLGSTGATRCKSPAQFEQHSKQSLRQMIHSNQLKAHNSMELPTIERQAIKRQASCDMVKLERDRESVKELAAFLKTRDPPPDNFMSIPESDDFLMSHTRKISFKIFHRQNSKKGSPIPRPLRLPDSAVAAKTTSGKWHIAISIPLEHDYSSGIQPLQEAHSARKDNHSNPGNRPGPITVLKPVIEDPEVPKPVRAGPIVGPRDSSNQPPMQRESSLSPHLLGAEATRTLQNYYRQESIQDLADKRDVLASKSSQSPSMKNVTTAPVLVDSSRRYSQRTDPRHSGGTAYSEASFSTGMGHSRVPSSASSVPSPAHFISSNAVEPGLRKSSSTKRRGGDLPRLAAAASIKSSASSYINSPRTPHLYQASVADSIDSDASSAKVGQADTALGYGTSDNAGAQVTSIRKVAQTPGPAPNRKLPDLPEGSDDGRSSRSRSRHQAAVAKSNRSSLNQGSVAPVDAISPTTSESPVITQAIEKSPRQLRQDKVKALRSRDMAALKAKTNYQQVIAANLAKGNRVAPVDLPKRSKSRSAVTPPRHVKRRSVSSSPLKKGQLEQQQANTVTPIMVVADIESPYGELYFPAPPARSRNAKSSHRTESSFGGSHTPPRSVTPSLASSDEEGMHVTKSFCRHPSVRERNKKLGRKSPAADEDLEARLKRVERSNAIMLQTLSAVVQMGVGFKELQQLLPVIAKASSSKVDSPTLDSNDEVDCAELEKERHRDLQGLEGKMEQDVLDMEPLMRQLRKAAKMYLENDRKEEAGTERLRSGDTMTGGAYDGSTPCLLH